LDDRAHADNVADSSQQPAISSQYSAKSIYRKGRDGRQGRKGSSISDPFATFASVAVKFLSLAANLLTATVGRNATLELLIANCKLLP
jgi:hypothetical protein